MRKTGWLLGVSALVIALGCGEESSGTAGGEPTPNAPDRGGDTQAGGDEAAAGPVVTDPTFELRAEAAPPYAAGQEGTFHIRLTPRGEYHVNQDFPMSIALSAPDGVTVPSNELGNEDAVLFDESHANFDIPFTAGAAGEHRVTARVNFAVCTPEACMPDERTLALVLPVR